MGLCWSTRLSLSRSSSNTQLSFLISPHFLNPALRPSFLPTSSVKSIAFFIHFFMFLFDSFNLNWPFAKLFLRPFWCLTTWLKTVQNLCMILIRVQIWWPCWFILLSFWRSSSIALSSFYSSASCLLTIYEFLFKFQSFFRCLFYSLCWSIT